MSNNYSRRGGTGFMGLLTILFIGLKLGGVIDWSWFLVLLPLTWFLWVALIAFFITLTTSIYLDLYGRWQRRNKK